MSETRDPVGAAVDLLRRGEQRVRILRGIDWPREVKQRFFASAAGELPQVEYPPFDAAPTLEHVAAARRQFDGEPVVRSWLERQATAIEGGARMLAVAGTAEFHRHAAELYGTPTEPLPDELGTSLELARHVDRVTAGVRGADLGEPPEACLLAPTVARQIRAAVGRFGDDAPEVVVVDRLSAKALAGPRRIALRSDACFTDRDAAQLIQHEAFVHVATGLNGKAQVELPILAAGHPGTTRTQEGLAVFSEMISGAMDVDRLRRLADRVLAIQMAVDGADFLEVYRFFLERTGDASQSFENARRVFRGGVLTGGAPFTKDNVYLDGLVRVHAFLRAVVVSGRVDCLRLLFCGKLDIGDVPALARLAAMGRCREPVHLPPWAVDLRFLVAYVSYATFLYRSASDRISSRIASTLEDLPRHDPGVGRGET